MNILLIQPAFPDTFWSFKHAIKFVGKKATNPPLGLLTVAAMLPASWPKKLIDLNTARLEPTWLDWADYVMISAMNIQRASVQEVVSACKQHGKKIIAGGPLFTGEYQHFPEIDHFILNEAELTLPPFLRDLAEGCPQRIYQTDEYADITQTPIPLWELIDLRAYDSMNVQYSRGCPYNCDFCNVTALLGHRPRTKTAAQLIAELDSLYQLGWRRNIFIVDDNFIGNKKALKSEVLPAMIEWRKNKKGCMFITEASVNLADDPQLIEMMVKAGFLSVFVGIETPDEEGLESCNKNQNQNRDLIETVNVLQRAGLQVMAGFIVGFDSDTPTIFDRQIDFIQKSGIVTAMVGLLQAPYGTRLYERLAAEGRLCDEMTGDNTDGTTNIVPRMNASILKRGYLRILTSIYAPPLLYRRIRTLLTTYNPVNRPVRLELSEVYAFLRSILLLGIFGPERQHFWKLLFWALLRKPAVFPLAVTLAIYGYHFRKISQALVDAAEPALTRQEQAMARRAALKSTSRTAAD
jgi:radical SAM superfamily enzyme YgiQ (UPF0313 family)